MAHQCYQHYLTNNVDAEYSWNFSRIDRLTIAAYLDETSAVFWSILIMYIYTFIAYYFLYVQSNKMAQFEFYSSDSFIGRYVANHSIIITGVNQKLNADVAAKKIKKVFDSRFKGEQTKVISCNTFRKSINVSKHWRKVKSYRAKLSEFNQESFASLSSEPHLIEVGSRLTCNYRQVDAVKFYQERLDQALQDWEETKKQYEEENVGVVILVFKTKACAEQVHDELIKLLGSQRLQ